MRWRRVAGVVSRELPDGETVVMNAEGTSALVLNATGGAVFDLCAGPGDIEGIAALLCETLAGADLPQVRRDVTELVQRLAEAGLLEPVEEQGKEDREEDRDACGPPPSRP